WGFVEEVHPPALLFTAIEDLLDKLLEAEPRAVQIQKALIRAWEDLPMSQAIAAGITAFAKSFETKEPNEMMGHFLSRRR
ncbi:MAG: putative enoyl-CoA hydratase, partial [Rubritepida sp.]|nr:putative enoyl-CoA hydratase [Rubritepida sp.]